MAKTTSNPFGNPFAEVDLTKIMSEFKLPGMDMGQVADSYRKNVEAIASASQLAVEGMQAVVKRQTEILRESVEDYSRLLRDFATPASAEEAASKQAELAKHTFETALAHMREISEMIAKANNESLEVLNKRVSAMLDEVKVLAKKTSKAA
jgi:phasin family protein